MFPPNETVFYDTPSSFWESHFRQEQAGAGVFVGQRYQRGGFGLGGLFSGLFKSALPLLKSVGKTVARQALGTGLGVVGDLIEGRDAGQSLESRGRNAARNLVHSAESALTREEPEPVRARKKKNPKQVYKRKGRRQSGAGRLGYMRTSRAGKVSKKDIFD